jgi:ABC-type branched-subunit amino acid transport system ATPase component
VAYQAVARACAVLSGGGSFPNLTARENLTLGGICAATRRALGDEAVFSLFPVL